MERKGLVYPRTQALGIEEYNYRTQRLDDIHYARCDVIVLHDIGCKLRRVRIWLVTSCFCHGDNSMVAAWPDPSSLRRVWLARLIPTLATFTGMSARGHSLIVHSYIHTSIYTYTCIHIQSLVPSLPPDLSHGWGRKSTMDVQLLGTVKITWWCRFYSPQ